VLCVVVVSCVFCVAIHRLGAGVGVCAVEEGCVL
jgi:hypothetical protein